MQGDRAITFGVTEPENTIIFNLDASLREMSPFVARVFPFYRHFGVSSRAPIGYLNALNR